ncbi:DUF6374 family protein [Nocardia sp. NPDC058518]|uniref:DUF6374 family protein n=1 Tax=Nocardia sp. NPDC058518 TaxID=3346534 RepID=UPI00365892AE
MTQMSRPDWAAATLAAVRQQLLDATAFGANLPADHVDDIVTRLGERLKQQFCVYRSGDQELRCRPLQPRSPTGCQGYRQDPR